MISPALGRVAHGFRSLIQQHRDPAGCCFYFEYKLVLKHMNFVLFFFFSTCACKHSAALSSVCLPPPPDPIQSLSHSHCKERVINVWQWLFSLSVATFNFLFFFSFAEILLPYFSGYTVWKWAGNQAQLEFRADSVCEFKRCQHWGGASCSHTAWHKQGKPQWQLRTLSNIV